MMIAYTVSQALIPPPVWQLPEHLEVSALLRTTTNLGLTVVGGVQLGYIKNHAADIMEASPVDYIRGAKLRGNLFEPSDSVTDGTVSCIDTSFYVDHTEPLEALERVREGHDWPLGELMEGHEFLLILEAKRGPRPKLRSKLPEDEEA